jgi:hypothetical protein
LNFDWIGPLEPATGNAAFVLASHTDKFAIHPEFKIRQFEEFLNQNYVGIRSVPAQGGKTATQRRDVSDQ